MYNANQISITGRGIVIAAAVAVYSVLPGFGNAWGQEADIQIFSSDHTVSDQDLVSSPTTMTIIDPETKQPSQEWSDPIIMTDTNTKNIPQNVPGFLLQFVQSPQYCLHVPTKPAKKGYYVGTLKLCDKATRWVFEKSGFIKPAIKKDSRCLTRFYTGSHTYRFGLLDCYEDKSRDRKWRFKNGKIQSLDQKRPTCLSVYAEPSKSREEGIRGLLVHTLLTSTSCGKSKATWKLIPADPHG